MKQDIKDILEQFKYGNYSIEDATNELCVLFNEAGKVSIMDRDIATIEALHDTLLDKGCSLNDRRLRESRELTHRMYESLNINNKN